MKQFLSYSVTLFHPTLENITYHAGQWADSQSSFSHWIYRTFKIICEAGMVIVGWELETWDVKAATPRKLCRELV